MPDEFEDIRQAQAELQLMLDEMRVKLAEARAELEGQAPEQAPESTGEQKDL